MCAYMYLCFYVGDQRTTSADIPQVLSTFFVDRVSMPWDLPSSLAWWREHQRCICLCLCRAGIISKCHYTQLGFNVGSKHLTQVLSCLWWRCFSYRDISFHQKGLLNSWFWRSADPGMGLISMMWVSQTPITAYKPLRQSNCFSQQTQIHIKHKPPNLSIY